MQYSSCPSLIQYYDSSPGVRITGFAIQELRRCEAAWEHANLFFYADDQKWGLIADGSRPGSCDASCHGPCLYVETPGQTDHFFHSGETYKYKIVILRCLACEATNSVCDGQIPCNVCFRNGVECFPYSELTDDNLVWSRWTAIPHESIDTSNFGRAAEENSYECLQPNSFDFQYPEEPFSSGLHQSSASMEDHSTFSYQQQHDIGDIIDPFSQPSPSTSSPADCLNSGTFCSPSFSSPENVGSGITNFQPNDARDVQTTQTVSRKRARDRQSNKGKGVERKKRARTGSSVMDQSRCLTRPCTPGPRDTKRQDQQLTEQPSDQAQDPFYMPTPPRRDPIADSASFFFYLDPQILDFENIQQNTVLPFGNESITPNGVAQSEQVNPSPPTESRFSSRSLSPVQQQPATNRKPTKKPSRRHCKPPSATTATNSTTTNPATLAVPGPGTRTGGGRYDGATYDAPPPSTSLPLRNCNLTAAEMLTYLPKHVWSHPDICMRLVDEGWGDATMADYITVARGKQALKNSIGKAITGIGKAKYPYFRSVPAEELARLPHDYGTIPIAGLDYSAAAGAETLPNSKATSQWCVKLHRKVTHLPQVSLATDGFAPGKTSLPMWRLAEGVRADKHPTGPDALDLTRCVRYAVQTRAFHEWIFPDDWEQVLTLVGGPALVTREHFDRPALERWKVVREGLSDEELFRQKGEHGRRNEE